jgi:hypothetical protein
MKTVSHSSLVIPSGFVFGVGFLCGLTKAQSPLPNTFGAFGGMAGRGRTMHVGDDRVV